MLVIFGDNMKKILVAGLVAAVMSTASFADAVCGGSGFYAGVNAGATVSKTKVKTAAKTYAAGEKYLDTTKDIAAAGAGTVLAEDLLSQMSTAIADAASVNKTKTRILFEGVFGYRFTMNKVIMGVEFGAGFSFGKTGITSKTETAGALHTALNPSREFAKLKNPWHMSLTPNIGYLFTPQFSGHLTFGLKLAKFKLETYKSGDNRLDGSVADLGNSKAYNSLVKKSSTRIIPTVGIDFLYAITPTMSAKIGWTHEFKTKVKLHSDAMPELSKVNVTGNTFRVGANWNF